MKVTKAENIWAGSQPTLGIRFDNDQTAWIGPDHKRSVRAMGFVFLGWDFEELLPAVEFPADPDNGRPEPTEHWGYTSDPTVLALVDRFIEQVDSGDFVAGPVEIPNA